MTKLKIELNEIVTFISVTDNTYTYPITYKSYDALFKEL